MGNINVTYEEVTATAAQMKRAQASMQEEVARLKSAIDRLVSTGFKTDLASGKFRTSYDQWDKGALNVIQGLDGMSKFLDMVVQKHQELDQTLGSQVGG